MTFSESYLTHLKCLENVGMTSIEPVDYNGCSIVPIQFLKELLPDPATLGPRTVGKTNIGCILPAPKTESLRRIICTTSAIIRSATGKSVLRPSPTQRVCRP